jgi:hypothetical protein
MSAKQTFLSEGLSFFTLRPMAQLQGVRRQGTVLPRVNQVFFVQPAAVSNTAVRQNTILGKGGGYMDEGPLMKSTARIGRRLFRNRPGFNGQFGAQ